MSSDDIVETTKTGRDPILTLLIAAAILQPTDIATVLAIDDSGCLVVGSIPKFRERFVGLPIANSWLLDPHRAVTANSDDLAAIYNVRMSLTGDAQPFRLSAVRIDKCIVAQGESFTVDAAGNVEELEPPDVASRVWELSVSQVDNNGECHVTLNFTKIDPVEFRCESWAAFLAEYPDAWEQEIAPLLREAKLGDFFPVIAHPAP